MSHRPTILLRANQPVPDAREALRLAEQAFGEGRVHDAERLVEIAYAMFDMNASDDPGLMEGSGRG